jgi:hypothetical protein
MPESGKYEISYCAKSLGMVEEEYVGFSDTVDLKSIGDPLHLDRHIEFVRFTDAASKKAATGRIYFSEYGDNVADMIFTQDKVYRSNLERDQKTKVQEWMKEKKIEEVIVTRAQNVFSFNKERDVLVAGGVSDKEFHQVYPNKGAELVPLPQG